MFDVAPQELLLVALVALVVIGPKDLPKAMRFVGYWVGRARSVMRQFRSGFDTMVREAELEEMEKKWAAENARIMAEHPQPTALPAPAPTVIDHEDGEAAPVMVEQPGFAPEPPPLPTPADHGISAAEPLPADESTTTELGEGAPPPIKKPRKRAKAAS